MHFHMNLVFTILVIFLLATLVYIKGLRNKIKELEEENSKLKDKTTLNH